MPGRLDLAELTREVAAGTVDTVVLAMTDMQGRLSGKRTDAHHFLDEVLPHAAEGCDYLLAVDVDMDTVEGYATSSWDRGYGDMAFVPDLATIRRVPWHPGTVSVLADLAWADGSPVTASPRQVLRRQLDRLAERGWTAFVGTELEFLLFRTPYEQAWRSGYRDLEPATHYNVDYSVLGTSAAEPVLRRIRTGMTGAGMRVESSKGECNLGQQEIALRYEDALTTADQHTLYKTGAKEIAAQEGCSLTFMAKFDEREGNSCHIHLSLRDADGAPVFAEQPAVFDSWLAGQLACLRELTLFLAPNVNSYKRYVEGSFAPTAIAWGRDNRTCALRVVGAGSSLRVENRVPGGDVNPYLAIAALVAAGLHGVEHELPLEPAEQGNAYAGGRPRVPATLRDARDLFAESAVARQAFGDDVVEHYLNYARVELAAFDRAVTDWERYRCFERL